MSDNNKNDEKVVSLWNEGADEKPHNGWQALKRLLHYFSYYKWQTAAAIFLMLIGSLAPVALTYLLMPLIDDVLVPLIGQGNADFSEFFKLVGVAAAICLAGVLSYVVNLMMFINITNNILLRVRTDMFTHMQDLPVKYFDKRTHGEIMSCYSNDIDTLREMISNGVPQIITSLITVAAVFVMMIVISWQLTLIVVGLLAIAMIFVVLVAKRSGKHFAAQQKELGALNGYIEEMIEGQKIVKVFCHEAHAEKSFSNLNANLQKQSSSAHSYANMMMPIVINMANVTLAVVAVVGSILSVNGLAIGAVVAFIQFARMFNQPVVQVSQYFNSVLTALAGAERIFALIDEPAEEDAGTVTLVNVEGHDKDSLIETARHTGFWAWKTYDADGNEALVPLRGDVRFENVTFSYVPDVPVLKNVSFYAKPGQKIAFVGSTGAGKTTIINLLNRFYDIDEGRILYDGIDLKSIKKADLRRSLGMVLQDTQLFTGTVEDNIRYGKIDADDEEVRNAAILANADGFIKHLENGYKTKTVARGANLSQGQMQLLSIARAAVSDPPVLILDEATSSIDTRTEKLIEKGMDKLMKNRTVLVIAHRLSTVRHANAIIVLEKGEIIERGSHNDLISQKGKYFQLYTGAFELE